MEERNDLELMQAIADNKVAESYLKTRFIFGLSLFAVALSTGIAVLTVFFGCPCEKKLKCLYCVFMALSIFSIVLSGTIDFINVINDYRTRKKRSGYKGKRAQKTQPVIPIDEQAKAKNDTVERLELYQKDTTELTKSDNRMKWLYAFSILLTFLAVIFAFVGLWVKRI